MYGVCQIQFCAFPCDKRNSAGSGNRARQGSVRVLTDCNRHCRLKFHRTAAFSSTGSCITAHKLYAARRLIAAVNELERERGSSAVIQLYAGTGPYKHRIFRCGVDVRYIVLRIPHRAVKVDIPGVYNPPFVSYHTVLCSGALHFNGQFMKVHIKTAEKSVVVLRIISEKNYIAALRIRTGQIGNKHIAIHNQIFRPCAAIRMLKGRRNRQGAVTVNAGSPEMQFPVRYGSAYSAYQSVIERRAVGNVSFTLLAAILIRTACPDRRERVCAFINM